ncbi:MAG TPA: hypothetical protein VFQ69_11610 [Rhizomicrobium sp.]|nr:hypothetical protein [Rhizomicrobium sp.]
MSSPRQACNKAVKDFAATTVKDIRMHLSHAQKLDTQRSASAR